jgi:hypothetical protein
MTVIPGRYDLRIPQRADYVVQVTLPFDCTDKEVYAEIWNSRRTKLILQLDVTWVDRVNGVLNIGGDWIKTRSMKSDGEWDLLVVDNTTGSRDFYLEGSATYDPGYTEFSDPEP